MRPRRRILLWSAPADQAGALAFTLKTMADVSVTKAPTMRKLRALLQRGGWNLVVIAHGINPRATTERIALARRLADCPVLVLTWDKDHPVPLAMASEATVVLPYSASNREIVQCVRTLSRRKRGPKKGPKPAATREAA